MTAPETTRTALRNEVLTAAPAALVMFAAVFLLRVTPLTPGARVGISVFLFMLAQTFFRQLLLRQRIGALGWAFMTVVASISASSMWFIVDH